MELQGRRALITGASRGIGEALAASFAAAGADVVLVARSAERLKELAEQVGGHAFPADLGDPRELDGLIERVEADCGPVDVLVNNAAVEHSGNLLDLSEEQIDEAYRVNLIAPVRLVRQVAPGMAARGSGHIVNLSSLAGVVVFPGLAPYSSSKAAINHVTACLRSDLVGTGIGCTLVELGTVSTGMLDRIYSNEATRRIAARGYKVRLLVDVTPEQVAEATVEAVRRNRRHLRMPARVAGMPMLVEFPRRMTEILFSPKLSR